MAGTVTMEFHVLMHSTTTTNHSMSSLLKNSPTSLVISTSVANISPDLTNDHKLSGCNVKKYNKTQFTYRAKQTRTYRYIVRIGSVIRSTTTWLLAEACMRKNFTCVIEPQASSSSTLFIREQCCDGMFK